MTMLNWTDVFSLPPAERLRIAAALWDSVADQPDQVPLSALQAKELDARYADYLKATEAGSTWAQVKASIVGH